MALAATAAASRPRRGGSMMRKGMNTMTMPASRAMALLLTLGAFALGGCEESSDARRYNLRIVGEESVLPLAEAMGRRMQAELHDDEIQPPVLVATGNDHGFALFCNGIGPKQEDMVVATRRMTQAEYSSCAGNNVRDVLEIPIGTSKADPGTPVFLYVKALHAYGVPYLYAYLMGWRENWGPGQFLANHGLEPLDAAARARSFRLIEDLEPLDRRSLG